MEELLKPKEIKIYAICFMDIQHNSDELGRIEFELFADTPKTSENFRMLCTGEMGESEKSGHDLHY